MQEQHQKSGKSKVRKRIVLLAAVCSGFVGLVGGVVGGAAGAFWVVGTLSAETVKPIVRNAVVEYDMPAEGARPIDIAGLTQVDTPLHPCLIGFLQENSDIVGTADWSAVRLSPYFKSVNDIINDVAFARGAVAITRGTNIIVRTPDLTDRLDGVDELLMFHELAHVAQYQEKRMDLPEYAASAAYSYASGDRPEDNNYELEAREISEQLVAAWKTSSYRAECHPDLDTETLERAESERPVVKYALYSPISKEYRVIEHRLHAKDRELPSAILRRAQIPSEANETGKP